jgi:hypothetical protein
VAYGAADVGDDEDDSRTMLRPFLGRARAAAPQGRVDSPGLTDHAEFESMLRLTPTGRESRHVLTFERAGIADLCGGETLSVAEISARLRKPIGVVRVVCGDLVADGVLQAFTSTPSVVDDVSLITRLIAGVRAL